MSAERPRPVASEERRVARSAGVVGAATMLSRVLGLVREQVMATLFGAGLATDAFNVAFRIPNLLRDLFAEGAMSSAFVPTFTGVRAQRSEGDAWSFGRQLLTALALVLAAVCAVGWMLTPWLVAVLAPGFAAVPGKQDLTVLLTRIMLPFLPAVALAAAAMGMLNACERFAVPALAPVALNLGMIAGALALGPVAVAAGYPAILGMALGAVIGAFGQFAVQLPALGSLGFRLRPAWPRDPAVRRVASLMLPATIGLAATQLNLTVSNIVATLFPQGSVSWLAYAFRLMQLPIGVFGVALATVSLPALSRAAVAGDLGAVRTTVSATVRLVFLLTAPAALWLAVMARPVIALLYEHGRFGAADTEQTAAALAAYCVGLPAFAAVGVLTRAFYALGDTRAPVRASFVAVAANLALNLLFVGPLRPLGLEHAGLALATSATSIVNLVQLAWLLRRRLGGIEGGRMMGTLARVVAAAALALLPSALALAWLGERWHRGALPEAAVVGGGLVVAGAIGWAALRALRVEELKAFESLAASLLRRAR
jgi:putative peptidoglycan lipid II flippase